MSRAHTAAQGLSWKKVAELGSPHTKYPHIRTPGLPVEERRAGLHGVDTPEENDSLAESHGLSQDEYIVSTGITLLIRLVHCLVTCGSQGS